jgi:four helix bundle protein
MGSIRHFTDLKVWQAAHRLFLDIASDVDLFPKVRAAWVIADQILRSSASIGANIAEGFSAASTKEYLRYLDIAFRTTNETENWLRNSRALDFLAPDAGDHRIARCEEIRRMLSGLRNSLKNRSGA